MARLKPVDWNFVLLKGNPFPNVPPQTPREAVWAGLPKIKEQFNNLLVEAQTSSTSQVVLNWGAYGSGKSHAAIYYGVEDRLPEVREPKVNKTWIIYVHTPREPAQANVILYRNIIEAIQFSSLRQVISSFIQDYGEEEAAKLLNDRVRSETLGRALWLLGRERKEERQLSFTGEIGKSPEWHRLLEVYFFSQHTKSDLKKLGLSRGIDTSQDRYRILGGLLQSLIGFDVVEELNRHSRVLLWIDEMEDLIYFTSRHYRPFTQGIRDLIDRLPSYFTLLMNFTLAQPENIEDTTVVLGQAIMDRVSKQIYFQEPGKDESYDYVIELLKHFRNQSPIDLNLPESYPFSDECLRDIINELPERTPRKINKRCSEIISQAITRGMITKSKKEIISMDFVNKLDMERLDLEID